MFRIKMFILLLAGVFLFCACGDGGAIYIHIGGDDSSIFGLVLYNGEGLDGVELTLRNDESQIWYQHTDDTGRYQFDRVPHGAFWVIPHKDGYVFNPDRLAVSSRVTSTVVADFEAFPATRVFYDLNEFFVVTGENYLMDFEDGTDRSVIPAGELIGELVSLGHGYWFSGQASPPTFVLCDYPGFDIHLSAGTRALGFHYAPFATNPFQGETRIQWTLFDEAGEIIETGDAFAGGFMADVDHHFFGIIASRPFWSVSIRHVHVDGSEGVGNWMFDDVRWAHEVRRDVFGHRGDP